MEPIINYIRSQRQQYSDELFHLLRIPSVSTDPVYASDVKQCAEFLAAHLRAIGLKKVEIMPTAGHPIVYAEWLEAQDAPTILLYGHYDVQPPDPLELWDSPPFAPTIREGKIYARGASDDKGQFFAHVKALDAYLHLHRKLPVNIKLLLEGEEEIGSTHLDEFVKRHADLLKADLVLVSDSEMFAPATPTICYGTRGIAGTQITLQGPSHDLHSGGFGGIVANPIQVLANLLAALKDREGRITIPGFYDDVLAIREAERQQFATLPFDENSLKKELGVSALSGEEGFSPLERVWTRPTLEINGIFGGYTGEGMKTVIPAKAMAKVTMRLVPNQDPDAILQSFKAYIQRLTPATVTVSFCDNVGAKPYVTPLDHPVVEIVAAALRKASRRDPVFVRTGGTIGVLPAFAEVLQAPIILIGLSQPNDNAHAPNEHLNAEAFYTGIEMAAQVYQELKNWKTIR